jgi:hypothetical protein
MIERARRWVSFWDAVEHPRTLGLVRVMFAFVVLYDFAELWVHGLVVPLFCPQEAGGWSDMMGREVIPLIYRLFPPEAWVGRLHHALICGAAFSLMIGFFSRTSALMLMLLWAQHQEVMPMADRAIDLLCRNMLFVLMLSGAGSWGSLDARLRTGSFWGDSAPIGAWARYLIITQLVVMYFTAGVQKVGFLWLPWGHFTALYVILQDPALARFPFGWLKDPPWLQFTQLGTVVTMLWQWGYPLVFLWYWYKNTADRPGWLRGWSNRLHLHLVWVVVGTWFHLMLFATMELGIFPWAMLALYPAFIDPDELLRMGSWLRDRAAGWRLT